MKTVSMLEFRNDAEKVLRQVQQGQRLILTYRGKPVARLEPIRDHAIDVDDPFYALDELADAKGRSLSNRDIDEIVYGR